MTELLKMPAGFNPAPDDYRKYWVAFAAAGLAGLSASPACVNMSPGDMTREAARSADLLLAQLKTRLTA